MLDVANQCSAEVRPHASLSWLFPFLLVFVGGARHFPSELLWVGCNNVISGALVGLGKWFGFFGSKSVL